MPNTALGGGKNKVTRVTWFSFGTLQLSTHEHRVVVLKFFVSHVRAFGPVGFVSLSGFIGLPSFSGVFWVLRCRLTVTVEIVVVDSASFELSSLGRSDVESGFRLSLPQLFVAVLLWLSQLCQLCCCVLCSCYWLYCQTSLPSDSVFLAILSGANCFLIVIGKFLRVKNCW